jgi:hypothetical protein
MSTCYGLLLHTSRAPPALSTCFLHTCFEDLGREASANLLGSEGLPPSECDPHLRRGEADVHGLAPLCVHGGWRCRRPEQQGIAVARWPLRFPFAGWGVGLETDGESRASEELARSHDRWWDQNKHFPGCLACATRRSSRRGLGNRGGLASSPARETAASTCAGQATALVRVGVQGCVAVPHGFRSAPALSRHAASGPWLLAACLGERWLFFGRPWLSLRCYVCCMAMPALPQPAVPATPTSTACALRAQKPSACFGGRRLALALLTRRRRFNSQALSSIC